MTYDDIRQNLALIHQSNDALLFAQFQDWIAALYEGCKERIVRCSPEERESLVGMANAYRLLLDDLQNPIQH